MSFSNDIELKKSVQTFDPESIPQDKTMRFILYGKTMCGKSHCLRSLLYLLRNRFNEVYLFSATASLQPDTYSYVPKSNQFETLNTEFMESIMDEQRKLKMKLGEKNGTVDKKLRHILFIIDDMISEDAIRHNKTIMKLYVQGRHYGLSTFVTSQVVGSRVSIPPALRNNAEYILSFSLFSEPDRKILIERFGSITSKQEGIEFFKQITQEPYTCCIFDTTRASANKLEDMMFSYKAPENIKSFMIGKDKPQKIINREFERDTGRKLVKVDLRFDEPDYDFTELNNLL